MNKALLPFIGQKRNALKHLKPILERFKDEEVTFVDLFGGSGLLSHFFKQNLPKARVIWNDFDGYFERVLKIDETNKHLAFIASVVDRYGLKRNEKITGTAREEIIKYFDEQKEADFATIGATLLFSGNSQSDWVKIRQMNFYRNRKSYFLKNDENFYAGIERRSSDFREIGAEFKGQGAVFLLDPPYINSRLDLNHYKGQFGFVDTLNLLDLMRDEKWILFSHDKSQIEDLLNYFKVSFRKIEFFGSSSGRGRHGQQNRYKDYIFINF